METLYILSDDSGAAGSQPNAAGVISLRGRKTATIPINDARRGAVSVLVPRLATCWNATIRLAPHYCDGELVSMRCCSLRQWRSGLLVAEMLKMNYRKQCGALEPIGAQFSVPSGCGRR